MSGPSIRELNRVNDPTMRSLVGMIRRMAVTVTSKALWQTVGYRIGSTVETLVAEAFTGIGFYARPPRAGKPEAIAVFVGGNTKSPAIVATRDEKTRSSVVGNLAEDETAIFNSSAVVIVRANGTVEIRLAAGVAEPTLKADTYRAAEDALLDALATWITATGTAMGTVPTFVDPAKTTYATASTAVATAITAFKAAGASYKTIVLRGQ